MDLGAQPTVSRSCLGAILNYDVSGGWKGFKMSDSRSLDGNQSVEMQMDLEMHFEITDGSVGSDSSLCL